MRTRKWPVTTAAILCLTLVVGCMSPQEQSWTCERAKAAHDAYQVAEQSGLVVDQDVIVSARSAASFLASYCGWGTSTPLVESAGRIRNGPQMTDRNGVLIVRPPD